MSTQTAPTKEEIAALTGSDLTNALEAASIDWKTGGSRADGSLTADEARAALTAHHHGTETSRQDPGRPDSDAGDTTPHGTDHDGDGDADDDDEDPRTPLERERDRQLEAGQTHGKVRSAALARARRTPAEQRAGQAGAKLVDGRVDNMSRRDDSDPLFGHFVIIDFGNEEHGAAAKTAVELVIGEGNARRGSGDYGVWVDNGELDPQTGYPLTCTILLRDEHSAQVAGVPHGALLSALPGGRR